MQIVEKMALPVYKMNLWSLELSCESVTTFSLAASILLVFPHLPKSLVSLKITSLPYITRPLLREIARRCTNLKELELSVVERLSTECCWGCFDELSTCVTHSPVGFEPPACNTAGNLAVGEVLTLSHETRSLLHCFKTFYARSLQPLGSLQRLSIGVFLSSPTVLKEHIHDHSLAGAHCQLVGWTVDDSFSAPHTPAIDGQMERPRVHSYRQPGGGVVVQERSTTIGYRPYTPTNCVLCWEAYGRRTREDELIATMRLAQNLRSLELVRWSSWFNLQKTTPPNLSPVNDRAGRSQNKAAELREAQWATFEVQRSESRIKVWRKT
jgi:hypothetical protein